MPPLRVRRITLHLASYHRSRITQRYRTLRRIESYYISSCVFVTLRTAVATLDMLPRCHAPACRAAIHPTPFCSAHPSSSKPHPHSVPPSRRSHRRDVIACEAGRDSDSGIIGASLGRRQLLYSAAAGGAALWVPGAPRPALASEGDLKLQRPRMCWCSYRAPDCSWDAMPSRLAN